MKWFYGCQEFYYGCLAMLFSGLLCLWFLSSLVDWEKLKKTLEERQ